MGFLAYFCGLIVKNIKNISRTVSKYSGRMVKGTLSTTQEARVIKRFLGKILVIMGK